MPKAILTELSVSKLSHGPTYIVWDRTLPTFGVRVGRTTKTYILKQHNRYHIIGRYPITLKQARNEAKRRLALKYFPQTGLPTQEAIKLYLEAKKHSIRPSSHYRFAFHLNRDFTFTKPIDQISRAEISGVLSKLKPSQANIAHTIFKAFLNWCVEQGHLTTNPIAALKRPHKLSSRDRLLTDEEIKIIWKGSYNHSSFGVLLRILLLSGQRLTQITHLQWAQISNDPPLIQFSADIMKSGAAHTIPLNSLLYDQLHEAHALITTPPPNPYIWGHKPFNNVSTHIKKFRSNMQIEHFTLHDFRRVLSSKMSTLKIPIDITEAILAHKTGSRSQIQRTYDRDTRLPQMREALARYQQHLLDIVK